MSKMKGFVSKHRSKMLLSLMVSGMALFVSSGSVDEPTVMYANNFQHGKGSHDVRGIDAFADTLSDLDKQADDDLEVYDIIFETREYNHDNPSVDNRPLVSGIVYEVFTTDDQMVARGQSDENGRFIVKDLPDGHYKWLHVSLADKYEEMVDFSYFSTSTVGDDGLISSYVILKQSDDLPLYDLDGNIVDEEGSRLDKDGNVIPEKVTPPQITPEKDDIPSDDDEPQRDENGNIIGEDGNLYDEDGKRVNKDGHFIDEDGRLVNSNGHLVDEDGNRINEDGHLVDEEGRRIDKDGYLIDVDKKDPIVDKDDESDDVSVTSDEKSTTLNTDDNQKANAKTSREGERDTEDSDEVADSAEEDVEKSNDGRVNPDDVQTYDKGVTGFVLIALVSFGAFIILNRQKRKV